MTLHTGTSDASAAPRHLRQLSPKAQRNHARGQARANSLLNRHLAHEGRLESHLVHRCRPAKEARSPQSGQSRRGNPPLPPPPSIPSYPSDIKARSTAAARLGHGWIAYRDGPRPVAKKRVTSSNICRSNAPPSPPPPPPPRGRRCRPPRSCPSSQRCTNCVCPRAHPTISWLMTSQ